MFVISFLSMVAAPCANAEQLSERIEYLSASIKSLEASVLLKLASLEETIKMRAVEVAFNLEWDDVRRFRAALLQAGRADLLSHDAVDGELLYQLGSEESPIESRTEESPVQSLADIDANDEHHMVSRCLTFNIAEDDEDTGDALMLATKYGLEESFDAFALQVKTGIVTAGSPGAYLLPADFCMSILDEKNVNREEQKEVEVAEIKPPWANWFEHLMAELKEAPMRDDAAKAVGEATS